MRTLEDIALVAVATAEVEAAVKAIEYSLRGLRFEKAVLFSHYDPRPESAAYDFVKIEPFNSVDDWGKFVVFELHKYVSTGHIMLIHADGFVVNPESWDDGFLEYDYIGAPWPIPKDTFSYRDSSGDLIRVGNSVSLRSRKLLKMPSALNLEWNCDHGFFHEDGFLCVQHRHTLQSQGIKYAPLAAACRFSHEKPIPEIRGIKPFAFHKWEGGNKDYPRFTKKTGLVKKLIRKFVATVKRSWTCQG